MFNLKDTFNSINLNDEALVERDNFLSRLLGIFSEDLVTIWSSEQKSKYRSIGKGRPNLYYKDSKKPFTLDFTLQEKTSRSIYMCEMKCWLSYEKYKYTELGSVKQIEKLLGSSDFKALKHFCRFSESQKGYKVLVDKIPQNIDGTILIWSSVNKETKEEIKNKYHFHDILSFEEIVNDLIKWKSEKYQTLIKTKYYWISHLFYLLTENPIYNKF